MHLNADVILCLINHEDVNFLTQMGCHRVFTEMYFLSVTEPQPAPSEMTLFLFICLK